MNLRLTASSSPSLALAAALVCTFATALAGCAKEGAATSAPSAPASNAVAPPSSSTPPAITSAATASAAAPKELAVGQPAPSFSVTASDGTKLDSATLKGKPVVVYFYPKDETPGCTKEACAFRDAWNDLAKTNVVLIGVSADSDESHRAFQAHHKLPFHLVSDADGSLAKKFDVPTFGRQSFVIGPDGNMKKIYRSVDVTAHAGQVLADVKS